MDEEGSQNALNTSNTVFASMNTIILNLSSSRGRANEKKKQSHKICSFKEKIKNDNTKEIQVIPSTGKSDSIISYKLRCKFIPIYHKFHKSYNASLLKDYVQRFYERTFEKMFLNRSQILKTATQFAESTQSVYQQSYQKNSSSSKFSTDRERSLQYQIGQEMPKITPSYLCQNQQLKCPQIKEENAEQPIQSSFIKIEEEIHSGLTRPTNHSNNSQTSNRNDLQNHPGSFLPAHESVIQSMVSHLRYNKQYFNSLFTDAEINHVNHNSNNNSNVNNNAILNFPFSSPLSSPSNFESCLPVVQLKKGEQQKFAEEINKIFKNFLHRGKEGRSKNIQLNNPNYQPYQSNSYAHKIDSKHNSKSATKKKPRKSIDSQQEDDVYEEEEEEEYFDEDDSCEINEEFRMKDDHQQLQSDFLLEQQKQGEQIQQNYTNQEEEDQIQQYSIQENNKSIATLTSLVLSKKKISENNTLSQVNLFQSQSQNQAKTEQIISLSTGNQATQRVRRKISSSSQSQSLSQQSKYHNLKNSFMHLIIQLFSPEVLYCFDIPQIFLDYSMVIIERMKNNSFKYRPVKGRYQYYSNIHYSTLFLKLQTTSLKEVNTCSQNLQYHDIFFKENLADCRDSSDFPVIKCNFYKLLIGSIVAFTLEKAEENLQNNDRESNLKYLNSSRYNYISKVKKGILKLQKGKHVIRF